MRTVRILAARVSGPLGRSVKGDLLTGPENDYSALVASGAAEWVDAPLDDTGAADGATWAWSVSDAREHVQNVSDAATLQVWHDDERRNPKYQPAGRKGVLDAIEERLGELNVDHAAEGLARGPEA